MEKLNIFNCNPLKEKTAVALGVFDGVHIGHRKVIKTAVELKKQGLSPVVFTFNTREVLKRGERVFRLMDEPSKENAFENLGVKYIVSPEFEKIKDFSPEKFVKEILVKKLNAKTLVCGENFTFGKNALGNCDTLKMYAKEYGFEVIVVSGENFQGQMVSSSRIRKALAQGEIAKANKMLGENFTIVGEVVHGNQIGRTWRFPTINQELDENMTPLKFGVYVSKVFIGDKIYTGVTNIGVKPTVNVKTNPLAETYIVGFEGDLYGKTVEVSLYEFIRAEKKFSSFEELKDEIEKNKIFAINYFERIDFNE